MNKTVITIIILTVLGLVVLILVSCGPTTGDRKTPEPGPAPENPISSAQPEPAPPAAPPSPVYNTYNNVDVTENHYQVAVLQDWHVTAGSAPGSYSLDFPGGNGSVRLVDVPANMTLEQFVLNREEPRLKRSVAGYQRLEFRGGELDGLQLYELAYDGPINPRIRTISDYIDGPDRVAVITLSSVASDFSKLRLEFNLLIDSFRWTNP